MQYSMAGLSFTRAAKLFCSPFRHLNIFQLPNSRLAARHFDPILPYQPCSALKYLLPLTVAVIAACRKKAPEQMQPAIAKCYCHFQYIEVILPEHPICPVKRQYEFLAGRKRTKQK